MIYVEPYLLCRGCIVGERSCVIPVCITQILIGGSLCGKSCVDDIVEILLSEGGDVEQWLEPRNISLCLQLIHYLLTLSLSLSYLAMQHTHIIYMLDIVCVPHLC